MRAAIEAMRGAFAELSQGGVVLPLRASLSGVDQQGVDLVMPCYSPALQRFSLKTVTVFEQNCQQGLPTIQGLLVLTDGACGAHLAILDGTCLTAIRTGAASGLATDLLARDDASVAAIFGAGVQARTQLEAVCCVRPIERVTVYDLDQAAAEVFATEMTQHLGVPVARAATPAENVHAADVVCTATSASLPVMSGEELPAGVHINAVGAFRPTTAEIPADVVCQARVVVDQHAAALEEAGDLLQPLQQGRIKPDHFSTELGAVLGDRSLGRRAPEETTLFKSVGVAIQDLYAAEAALQAAYRLGLGVPLSASHSGEARHALRDKGATL
jgi:ornithine cyclodeaminase/alanine dehydrogenase-like protein (mu-crystallin family)